MSRIRSSLPATALAVTLGLSLVAVAPANAAKKKAPATAKAPVTKTVTACVNKKSGATKVLLGKKAKRKCAKGWTKTTWSVSGPKGANGTNGVNGTNGINGVNGQPLSVRDAAGNRIGTFGGLGVSGIPIPIIQVLGADGGLYPYLENGQYFPLFSAFGSSASPLFRDAACAGTAYFGTSPGSWGLLSKFVGGSLRFGFRAVTNPSTLDFTGPARVWKLTSTTEAVPPVVPPVYDLSPTGVCTAVLPADAPDPGDLLVTLESVPSPPDGVGRLTIG